MIVQELFSRLGIQLDEKSWGKADSFLSAVKGGFIALVAGFGIHQIAEMVHGVSEMADAAVKASAKLGITVDAVQELGYAAKLSDIEQGELEGGLSRLARGLDDVATTGKGPTADALKRLGISFKDLKGESLDANLEVIADAFEKMPDGMQKSSLASDLFGRNLGSKMIPFLNAGSKGIRELREEAVELGIVVGEDVAKQFEEFNDNQTRLSEAWRGLKVQVVTALLPVLAELVEKFQHWITNNRELISSALTAFIKGAVFAAEALAFALDLVMKGLQFFADHGELTEDILIALAVAASGLAVSMLQVAAAWVIAALPFIVFTTILTGIVIAIRMIIKHFGGVKATGIAAWNAIKGAASATWDFIKSIPGRILDGFIAMGEGIKDALGAAFDWMVEKAKSAASEVWSAIKDIPVIGRIAQFGEDVLGGPSIVDQMKQYTQQHAGQSAGLSGPAGVIQSLGATFDTQVNVTPGPGMDEAQLADMVAAKTQESQKEMLNQALDAVRGGRR